MFVFILDKILYILFNIGQLSVISHNMKKMINFLISAGIVIMVHFILIFKVCIVGHLFICNSLDQQAVKDFIGLVVRNGVLFCVYKLGGMIHEIETSKITKSSNNKAFMDRVDFRR